MIKPRRKWKVHMVLYILAVFTLDKYVLMYTYMGICIRKGLFALSLKICQIFIFHILAEDSSQPTEYSSEIPFIICKLTHYVLFIIYFGIKIKMLMYWVSPFLACVPQETLAAHRSQMVAWLHNWTGLAATWRDVFVLSNLNLKGMYLALPFALAPTFV